MKRLCCASGLSGYKTNHSLRVTAATRLFQSGAELQAIAAQRVFVHTRVSSEQREALSDILNTATNTKDTKKRKVESKDDCVGTASEGTTPFGGLQMSGCQGVTACELHWHQTVNIYLNSAATHMLLYCLLLHFPVVFMCYCVTVLIYSEAVYATED